MKFCHLFQLQSFPTEPSTLVLFVVYKTVVLRHSTSTTANSLSAIRRANLAMGSTLPTPSSYFPLREALRGAKRYLSKPTIQKLPMNPNLLMLLIGGSEWGFSMRCLYLTLWFTFSRLASLIPTSKSPFHPTSHLSWSNVLFEENGVRIVLEKTKTIQCLERNLQFFIPKHRNQSICLYTQLQSLYSSTPFKLPHHPVFITCQNGMWFPLSRSLADPYLKAALVSAGVTPSAYGWSSFRRGGATTGFIATKDIESLREHGDWKSNAYIRYLSLSASKRTHLVSALQNVIVLE